VYSLTRLSDRFVCCCLHSAISRKYFIWLEIMCAQEEEEYIFGFLSKFELYISIFSKLTVFRDNFFLFLT
jgi:hypothetical protein